MADRGFLAAKKWLPLALFFMLSLPFAFAQVSGPVEAASAAQAPSESAAEDLDGPESQDAVEETEGLSPELNYYIDRSGAEPRFIQRLIWDESEFVLRYVVIVQKLEQNGSYSEVDRADAEGSSVELSLVAGKYRYCLDVYDLLDELSFTTEWREFEIIRAIQPRLTGFSPQSFYLDEDEIWEITVRGGNLLSNSVFYLVRGGSRIRPQRHIGEGDSSRLVFSASSLVPGVYDVYVVNPGGLDARLGTFSISFRKPFDLNISVGYAPIIPLYGFLFRDFGETPGASGPEKIKAPFPESVYPLGAMLRVSFLPFKRVWGYLGAEFTGSFSFLEGKGDEGFYSDRTFFLNTHLSFLYQKYFFKKTFALNFSLGAGVVALLDFHYEYPLGPPTESKNDIYASGIAGISGTVFFLKPFYINAGADFTQVFSPDSPMPGFLRPFITVGIQL